MPVYTEKYLGGRSEMKFSIMYCILIFIACSCGKDPVVDNSIDVQQSSPSGACRLDSECREICQSYNYNYESDGECSAKMANSGIDVSSGYALSACSASTLEDCYSADSAYVLSGNKP